MKQHKFNVGDRVAFYGQLGKSTCYGTRAIVTEIYPDSPVNGGLIRIELNEGFRHLSEGDVSPKQCQLLKKKAPRRRLWIKTDGALSAKGLPRTACGLMYLDQPVSLLSPKREEGWIEFSEVRRKK